MRKFILVFTLIIISIAFIVLFLNFSNQTKKDNNNKGKDDQVSTEDVSQRPSFYQDYTKSEYDSASSNKRVLVLYFTSNWCDKCLEQDNILNETFSELANENLTGLKIHILDSETTVETDAVAKKFDVFKEQTIVVLDQNGVLSFKQTGLVNKEPLKAEIMKAKGVQSQ